MHFVPTIFNMALKQAVVLLGIVAQSVSHSWVESLMVFNSVGTMVGAPGYTRGTISRLDPSFNDFQIQHLLPQSSKSGITSADQICKATQTIGNYTIEFPSLQAWPGAFIALQYQENGHVTLPQLTPQKKDSGTVYIYGTSSPSDEDTLASVHRVWNEHGTGGDGRGRLLASRRFDDGQCYQINEGPISKERQNRYHKVAMDPQGADLWCQNDIRLPPDVRRRYSLYWVWDWPTAPSDALPEGKAEIYTSCVDIDIVSDIEQGKMSFVDGQDLNLAGIKEQLVDQA